MDETIDWLRGRPYYESQIAAERVVPGRSATFGDLDVAPRLAEALRDRGISRPYRHQAEAIAAVRSGSDVVLSTDTASGKSLAYLVPAFERAMDGGGCTLYVAPQVALVDDQAETLSAAARDLGFASGVGVERYTGRLSREEKRAARNRRPTVLLATPDMLHYGILPHAHRLWDWFFSRLETVVVDEVHEYRGVFGSHVSLVLRRLARVAARFESDPDYVLCSATIADPVSHAAAVTGRPAESFVPVSEDASESGPTHWLFWNPPEYATEREHGRRRSSHVESRRLFVDLVARGHQTVVFTGSRQVAERYATDSADVLRDRGRPDLADRVTAYQAALPRDRRVEIEAGLRSGEVAGAWSTSALELGVDIGGLDAVILDGYPGTRMETRQRAGRAGRGSDPSLVILVAGEDQLDQYLVADPDAFFDGDPERAVVNPENDQLLPDHVACAARENWLGTGDEAYFGPALPDVVTDLEERGRLERRSTHVGTRWTYAGGGSPQHEMSLRSIGDREISLLDGAREAVVATLPLADALRDAHPGAVYHHQGTAYEVADLDLDRDLAVLEPTAADHYTGVLSEKDVTVERDLDETTLPARDDLAVRFAEVTIRERITGYERRDRRSGRTFDRQSLSLPETSLRTRALYFTVPDPVEAEMRAAAGSFAGGIHAAEHGLIAMLPLAVLCDRRDVGGLSTPRHPHTGRSTIFVYDGYPGGVGLTRAAFERLGSLAADTRRMIDACPCEAGCPACVQSPHCGNANEPLDKDLAVFLLASLVDPPARVGP